MKTPILIVAVASIELTACGAFQGPPTSGTVMEKQYVPSRDWVDREPNYVRQCVYVPYTYTVYSGSGSTRSVSVRTGTKQSCTSILIGYSSIPRHEREYFRFYLKDYKDPKHLGWRDVSHTEYDSYEVGSPYPSGPQNTGHNW